MRVSSGQFGKPLLLWPAPGLFRFFHSAHSTHFCVVRSKCFPPRERMSRRTRLGKKRLTPQCNLQGAPGQTQIFKSSGLPAEKLPPIKRRTIAPTIGLLINIGLHGKGIEAAHQFAPIRKFPDKRRAIVNDVSKSSCRLSLPRKCLVRGPASSSGCLDSCLRLEWRELFKVVSHISRNSPNSSISQ